MFYWPNNHNLTTKIPQIVLLSIILLSVYFASSNYHASLHLKQERYLEKLHTIAKMLSLSIDVQTYKNLLVQYASINTITSTTQDSTYLHIHNILKSAAQKNDINTPIYLLSKDSLTQSFYFGVTSAAKPYYRHPYTTFPPQLLSNYATGGLLPYYKDEHGLWMSAFAPLTSTNGEVIAVVQVDHFFEDFALEARQALWYNIVISLVIVLVISSLLYKYLRILLKQEERYKAKITQANTLIKERNIALNTEKNKVNELLYNILPIPIAQELKQWGKVKPVLHPCATVVFTDFSNFTQYSEQLSPPQLLEELNTCFSAFDKIVAHYKLEKLKTIGDAYMFVGGILGNKQDHAQRCIKAAIEMQAFITQRRREKQAQQVPYFDLKIGIHSGAVVAGIVGENKFAYDIWGDTVNTAARIETACEAGRINLSLATKKLVEKDFLLEYRGKIAAKNKGYLAMYYLALHTNNKATALTNKTMAIV